MSLRPIGRQDQAQGGGFGQGGGEDEESDQEESEVNHGGEVDAGGEFFRFFNATGFAGSGGA